MQSFPEMHMSNCVLLPAPAPDLTTQRTPVQLTIPYPGQAAGAAQVLRRGN